ncbi:MAG: alcohol dehydrogenase catalytic domain-containing protein, partial [Planctomycetota bacterium]
MPKPQPGPGEALLRVEAAWIGEEGTSARPGSVGAGTIEAVGAGIEGLAAGERVVPSSRLACGTCESCEHGLEAQCLDPLRVEGLWAEFALLPARVVEHGLGRLPDTLPAELAVFTDPLAAVLKANDRVSARAGERALVLGAGADRPAAAGPYYEYLTDGGVDGSTSALVVREVPLVRETARPVLRLLESGRIRWRRDPDDWFQFRIPDSFELVDGSVAFPSGDGAWTLDPARGEGVWALFELPEQMVGFPFFTIEAPEGTIVEAMVQESHSEDN